MATVLSTERVKDLGLLLVIENYALFSCWNLSGKSETLVFALIFKLIIRDLKVENVTFFLWFYKTESRRLGKYFFLKTISAGVFKCLLDLSISA